MKFNKAECKVLHLGHGIHLQAGQRSDWEQPCRERLGGDGWWKAHHELALSTHSPQSWQNPGLHPEEHGQQGEGEDCPTLLCLWDSTCSAEHSSGALNVGNGTAGASPEVTMLVRGPEHLPCEEAEKVGAVRPGERRLSGDFRRTFQHLKALQGSWRGTLCLEL